MRALLPRAERKTQAMKYDFSRLGENIASLRRAAGLTQELLADRLGVTSQAVSKWERQLSCPDVSLLPAMAETFGVGIDALFAVAEPDTAPTIDALPWEEDGRVRIAVFEGKRLCPREVYECPDGEEGPRRWPSPVFSSVPTTSSSWTSPPPPWIPWPSTS